MLIKEIIDEVKTRTKEINKIKDIDVRLSEMIKIKDKIRTDINDELDELFSSVNLKTFKINLDE